MGRDALKEIYDKYYLGSTRDNTCMKIKDGFLTEVAEFLGCSEPEAYVATDYLFRPENFN